MHSRPRYLLVILILSLQVGCYQGAKYPPKQEPVTPIIEAASFLAFLPTLMWYSALELAVYALGPSYERPQWVSLDDAYKATFGISISDPRVDRKTGQISGDVQRVATMTDATAAFQRLLISKGTPEATARHYVICALEAEGKTLISLVYRRPDMQPIEVISKHTGTPATLHPQDVGWHEPYQSDVKGQAVDYSVDWTAVDSAILKQDKAVGILMVLAAQSVREGFRQEYWETERRWLDGQIADVMRESSARVKMDVR